MANWYVSQKVATSGAGTSLAVAFKTITEAITASAGNDTIYVYSGVYNEELSLTKGLKLIGIGIAVLDSGFSLNTAIQASVPYGAIVWVHNFTIQNYLQYSVRTGYPSLSFKNNILKNPCNLYTYNVIEFENNVFNAPVTILSQTLIKSMNNIFHDNVSFPSGGSRMVVQSINCNFKKNAHIEANTHENSTALIYCNFESTSQLKFKAAASYVAVMTPQAVIDKHLADTGILPLNTSFQTSKFLTPIFNNSAKNNYTLKYDVDNNPIAFATFAGTAIGAFQAASNIVCKDTANSGDCDIYNIGTDSYGLGIFAGKTNVGVIDNANEKLYRTSDGANNWGVFVASTEFPKTHVIRNLQMFGTIIDRNGGQVTKLGIDFAYNYQIDVLVKWSDTLSKSALLAETSRAFVRFRLRPNETNYYVDNSGTLVGDGEPTYLSLVNSSDGGSGSLVPTKVTAKSFVCIIILQDA